MSEDIGPPYVERYSLAVKDYADDFEGLAACLVTLTEMAADQPINAADHGEYYSICEETAKAMQQALGTVECAKQELIMHAARGSRCPTPIEGAAILHFVFTELKHVA